ncbi:hypothetical protein [Shouchella clausii]
MSEANDDVCERLSTVKRKYNRFLHSNHKNGSFQGRDENNDFHPVF